MRDTEGTLRAFLNVCRHRSMRLVENTGARDLVQLPCAERHGLVWAVPAHDGTTDLDAFPGGLNDELPFYEFERLKVFRTIEAEYRSSTRTT